MRRNPTMTGAGRTRWRGVAALLLCAAAGPAAALDFTLPPPSEHEHVGARRTPDGAETPPAGRDLYRLPDDYRTPSGQVNHEALVARQKKRLGIINRTLEVHLRGAETPHYLVFSNAGGRVTAWFLNWSEALYRSLLEQFGLPRTARVWDGKCVLILFDRRQDFEAYARQFDGHPADRAGAYFAVEAHGPGGPALVHVCVPVTTANPRRLQELFAHEGTHAFFELYKTPGRLPLWLHEGLAEYMTTVNDASLRPAKWARAAAVARSGRAVAPLFTVAVGRELTLDQYAVAFTMVDYLLKVGRPRFKRFVDGLKDGKDQAEALREAYGFGLDDLSRRWHAYVTVGSP